MPLSKVTGKSRGAGQGGTHAHYAGEFGSTPRHQLGAREQTSELAKSPEYRAARAEHFAHVAKRANEEHARAHAEGRGADAAQHALAAAHASQMANKHAKAAEKMAPNTEHHHAASRAAQDAKLHHGETEMRTSLAAHNKRQSSRGEPIPHGDAQAQSSHKIALEATASANTASLSARNSPSIQAHHDAADAHEKAAAASKAYGDNTQAAQHEAHRQNHLGAALDMHHEATVRALRERESHPAVIRAKELTARAQSLSDVAQTTGSRAAHDAAAVAHGEALSAARALGESGMVKIHASEAERHAQRGSGVKAHQEMGESSDLAQSVSEKIRAGYSKDHTSAERLHRTAAEAAASLSAHDLMKYHVAKAEEHARHTSQVPRPTANIARESSKRAEQISALAKASPSAAAHADAARAHSAAAAAFERHARATGSEAGYAGQIELHRSKASLHEADSQKMMAGHTTEEKAMIRQIEKDQTRGAVSGAKYASELAFRTRSMKSGKVK